MLSHRNKENKEQFVLRETEKQKYKKICFNTVT